MAGDSVTMLFVLVGVFVVPLVLGHYISRAVRMPDQGWRVATVFFSLFAAAAVTWFGWPPKLGIDLSGGSILVYEIDDQGKGTNAKVDDNLVQAVTRRVNPGGVKEVMIRPYGVRQIEIIIPRADEAELERIKDKISKTGLLEFRITANQRDHANLIELAKKLDPATKSLVVENSDGTKEVAAIWLPIRKDERDRGYFESGGFITRKNDKGDTEVLVVIDPQNVTGQYLASANAGTGPKGPNVAFVFDSTGSRLFGRLTSNNLPDNVQGFHRHLGIVLDGYLYSAPQINEAIYDRGEISGNFKPEETEDLAAVLKAGSLPTALRKEPSSSLLTGATLGEDTIKKGVYSMLVSTVAVIIFMVIYYRFAGVVANVALLLNVLLIVAFMIMFNAAFTLSGLAGLALTVGMAVDANVLIYERMREELARGATLRMAIRNGFGRATTTIIDANVTTLISAVVLYVMGSDQVKGFAITLILGIVMNLYTAIFVSRVCFDIAEKIRFITQLRMLHVLSNPHFDFIGKRRIAIVASLIVIGVGMAGVYERGKGLLDIDFTGGVSVQALFREPIDIAEVRREIDKREDTLPDATVQDVRIAGETPNTRYVINTSNPEIEQVKTTLDNIFQGKLLANELKIAQLTPIPATGAENEAAPADGPGVSGAKPEETRSSRIAPRNRAAPDDSWLLALADAPAIAQEAKETDDEPAAAAEKQDEASKEPASATEEPALSRPTADQSAEKPATSEPTSKSPGAVNENRAPAGPSPPPGQTTKPQASSSLGTSAPGGPGAAAAAAATKAAEQTLEISTRFAGGTTATVTTTIPIGHDQLTKVLLAAADKVPGVDTVAILLDLTAPGYEPGSDASFDTWELQTNLPPDKTRAVLEQAHALLASQPFFPAANKIGAAVAATTQQQAAVAMVASLILILAYMWFRFSQVMFGVAGVLAVVHDVFVTLGALALSAWLAKIPGLEFLLIEPFKISLPIIAAFLTIIGYSLNDTIVIFDRIREVRGKSPVITPELANTCINQTLSRTILTSLTVFIVVLILYAVGGEGIHGFAFALVVGVVAGTYSTVYIATPIVLWMNRSAETARVRQSPSQQAARQKTSTA